MTKETASFIEKLAERGSKRTQKKELGKTEGGIVHRLAKQGLIDKAKAKAARESTSNINPEEEEERGPWLLVIFSIIL